jgi:SAM-dependent methyltransferase
MLNELAKDPLKNINFQGRNALNRKIKYFRSLISQNSRILDVGQRNLLTEALENEHKIKIDNTSGDLDLEFEIPGQDYDVIIYSHTIEHQFNPLYTMIKLKDALNKSGKLYILMPERGKLLWTEGHYHEIDDYRFKLLAKRAELEILDKTKEKVWRDWKEYFKGIRPFYRFFREYDVIYVLKK